MCTAMNMRVEVFPKQTSRHGVESRRGPIAYVAVACLATAAIAIAAHAQAQPVPNAEGLPVDLLPHDLSPWGMFMNADRLVKAVMIGLAFASLVTWTIALAKWLELAAFKVRLRKLHQAIAGARSLAEARSRAGAARGAAARLVGAAVLELEKSPDRSDREGIRERLAATIERIERQPPGAGSGGARAFLAR